MLNLLLKSIYSWRQFVEQKLNSEINDWFLKPLKVNQWWRNYSTVIYNGAIIEIYFTMAFFSSNDRAIHFSVFPGTFCKCPSFGISFQSANWKLVIHTSWNKLINSFGKNVHAPKVAIFSGGVFFHSFPN